MLCLANAFDSLMLLSFENALTLLSFENALLYRIILMHPVS